MYSNETYPWTRERPPWSFARQPKTPNLIDPQSQRLQRHDGHTHEMFMTTHQYTYNAHPATHAPLPCVVALTKLKATQHSRASIAMVRMSKMHEHGELQGQPALICQHESRCTPQTVTPLDLCERNNFKQSYGQHTCGFLFCFFLPRGPPGGHSPALLIAPFCF